MVVSNLWRFYQNNTFVGNWLKWILSNNTFVWDHISAQSMFIAIITFVNYLYSLEDILYEGKNIMWSLLCSQHLAAGLVS